MKRKELLLDQVDKLRSLKLPPKWEVAKLEVSFKRRSGEDFYKDAEVIYDDLNGTFYVKTAKSIVYPEEVLPMNQAIAVMKSANEIIGSKRKQP